MLANLPKWTGDASNISGLARKRSASAEMGAWESDPAADAEAAYLNGLATDLEPDAITQPDERLRVYNLAGYGEPLQLSEVLISSKSLATEAAALAYMRNGPYDVRPSLLLLLLGQDMREVSRCLEYGCNYLEAWCCRRGLRVKPEALAVAALDALAVTYKLRTQELVEGRRSYPLAVPATKSRAKNLAMRDVEYGKLRKVALSAYQLRYLEAMLAFEAACDVEGGGIATRQMTLSVARQSRGRRGGRAHRGRGCQKFCVKGIP